MSNRLRTATTTAFTSRPRWGRALRPVDCVDVLSCGELDFLFISWQLPLLSIKAVWTDYLDTNNDIGTCLSSVWGLIQCRPDLLRMRKIGSPRMQSKTCTLQFNILQGFAVLRQWLPALLCSNEGSQDRDGAEAWFQTTRYPSLLRRMDRDSGQRAPTSPLRLMRGSRRASGALQHYWSLKVAVCHAGELMNLANVASEALRPCGPAPPTTRSERSSFLCSQERWRRGLAIVAKQCKPGQDGRMVAREFTRRLFELVRSRHHLSQWHLPDVLGPARTPCVSVCPRVVRSPRNQLSLVLLPLVAIKGGLGHGHCPGISRKPVGHWTRGML